MFYRFIVLLFYCEMLDPNYNPAGPRKPRFWPDSVSPLLTTPDTGRCQRMLAPAGFEGSPNLQVPYLINIKQSRTLGLFSSSHKRLPFMITYLSQFLGQVFKFFKKNKNKKRSKSKPLFFVVVNAQGGMGACGNHWNLSQFRACNIWQKSVRKTPILRPNHFLTFLKNILNRKQKP